MNTKKILSALRIDRQKLARWVRAGLPHHGRGGQMTFDESAVRRWLLKKNFAQVEHPTVVVKSQELAAVHFGVTPHRFAAWIAAGAPGRRGEYDVEKIASWIAQQQDDKLLLTGGVSPALERYRLARAKREELLYERDLGQWLPREKVHEGLGIFAAILRQAGEALQRQFGPDAHNILSEAINDALRQFDRRFADKPEALDAEDPWEASSRPTVAPAAHVAPDQPAGDPPPDPADTTAAATSAAPIDPVSETTTPPAPPPDAPTTKGD